MTGSATAGDSRRRHYEVEKELAARLRDAPPDARRALYREVYDELFRRVPDHPQLLRRDNAAVRAAEVERQLRVLRPFLRPESTFLEVGAGDCSLAFAVAAHVRRVVAVDVSSAIVAGAEPPPNAEVLLSDGTSIPVEHGSVDVAYSHQLMEHLHPDDAAEQARNVRAALAPEGVYLCLTPNRLSGPHDVSAGFDDVATGFHLREYTTRELAELLREAGFTRVRALVRARGVVTDAVPAAAVAAVERGLERLPRARAQRLAAGFPLRHLLGAVTARP